jgi:hypothetical protein
MPDALGGNHRRSVVAGGFAAAEKAPHGLVVRTIGIARATLKITIANLAHPPAWQFSQSNCAKRDSHIEDQSMNNRSALLFLS